MVSSFHDGPSQASTMHMPVLMEGLHNAEPTPNAGHSYQYSQHHQQQRRKRKAETQDTHNERLSKRLSLLNLEQNGSKLYVPVEQPPPRQSANNASSSSSSSSAAAIPGAAVTADGDEMMLLDDTKHKVYIYNLDDELSSDADSDPDDARLIFLPDVERHLRANRIVPGIPGNSVPRPILPNKEGELAGMQLVLYDDGVRSVSVPEEQDSVRKAIIEARERHRRRQQDERDARAVANNPLLRPESRVTFATPVKVAPGQMRHLVDDGTTGMASLGASSGVNVDVDVDVAVDAPADGDADAMEID